MKTGDKVFVSSNAVTQGIREGVFEKLWGGSCKSGCYLKEQDGCSWSEWLKYVHPTRDAAIADANRQRDRKISSLRKQIEKLEKVKFE